MAPFGRKDDSIKQFEEMRSALGAGEKPSDGPASPGNPPAEAVTAAPTAPADQTVKRTAAAPEECASVVSAGSTWHGSLKLDGSVRVDGQFTGEIAARETVHLSEGAQVDAQVEAAFVVIAGTFQGQVRCRERLELLPTSRVQGELVTKTLKIHEGAFIAGQLQMTDADRPAESAVSTDRGRHSTTKPKSPTSTGPGEASVHDAEASASLESS